MTASTEYRTAVEVAKTVRVEIKAAVKAGQLPDVTYRVRSESFAGGQAVDITMLMDEARAYVPTEPTDVEFLQYRMDTKLSAEVKAAAEQLRAICRRHREDYLYVMAYLNDGRLL